MEMGLDHDGMAFTFERQKEVLSDMYESKGYKLISNSIKKENDKKTIKSYARFFLRASGNDKNVKDTLEFMCFDL